MSTSSGSYSTPTSTSAFGTFLTSLPTFFVSLVFMVGIIVLIALHDVTSAAGLPLIAVVGGVHAGAAVSSNATTNT